MSDNSNSSLNQEDLDRLLENERQSTRNSIAYGVRCKIELLKKSVIGNIEDFCTDPRQMQEINKLKEALDSLLK